MNHDDLPPGVTAPGYPVTNYNGAAHAVRDTAIIAGMGAAAQAAVMYAATGDSHAAGKAATSQFTATMVATPIGFVAFFATVLGLLNLFGGAPTSGFFELVLGIALWWVVVLIHRANVRYINRVRNEAWLRSLPPPQPLVRTYIETTGVDVTKNL